MPCYPRERAVQGQVVALQIQYFDSCGKKVPADNPPQIQITDLDGLILLTYTDKDVEYLGDGLYQYQYRVPETSDAGMWIDEWKGVIDGATLDTTFMFTVVPSESGLTATSGLGKIKIGDDVNFDFSDEEIYGINIILNDLKSRLRSSGDKPLRDENGAFIYDGYGEIVTEECNLFPDDILVTMICSALSEFNLVPFFTSYSFASLEIQTLFSHLIAEGAMVMALSSQSILEAGREMTISDGGINYQPATLSGHIQSVYSTWLSSYRERLKFVKNSIRPGPRSFGTSFNKANGPNGNPAISRLRLLRARRII